MKAKSGLRTFGDAVAIITGAASGIGAALSRELARRGCEVVLADLQVKLVQQVAQEIRKEGGTATAVKVDVTNFSAVDRLVKNTFKRTGRLDYLFNNAGIGVGGPMTDFRIDDWDYIIRVNLYGEVNGTQAAYKLMVDQGFGHIVNTASMAGLTPGVMVPYNMTKFAIVGLSRSMRIVAGLHNIRVSVVCPGAIRTPMLTGGKYGRSVYEATEEDLKKIADMFEKMRPMDPAVFAKKVLDQVAKNKAVIVVPAWWKIFWWIDRLFPNAMIYLTQKQMKKMMLR